MRHMKAGRKLGRNSSHRKAMYRNMVTSLMLHGRIRTTDAKAKELRRIADRVITLGKRVPPSKLAALDGEELVKAQAERVHAIRQARKFIVDRDVLHRVFNEYSERYQTRPGGYTRLVKLGFRTGDNAPMTLIELMPAYEVDESATSSDDAAAAAVDEGGEE
ncbi:MAG: 50S ribosomal protein L17 [Alphaproteobacteria bacterium]|nr:50S ribosomal protein L17 [Alphaproteobacteria bacterium]